ncbi:SDR family oxidoreductase [Geomicrobium sp. JCM 19039]|uniref:SDR family oxidoreductase n=1 Tax=Geomicrobium sp. JCM 19039 TaxID=1460636 RepID=UPI00045F3D55|nr:SDR family oxidoreductase [Geomicrobium sp. JCM 19039]GAK12927.1 3-oxoacyl-[acyl-carrier protein] reductase [Geomicrobium sp. JCM 19039]
MKHALVTAGSKGLGRKVTEMLIKNGYVVTISYRSDWASVDALKTDLDVDSAKLLAVQADVTKSDDIEHLFRTAIDHFGRLDVLVNNAGPYIFERKKIFDYTNAEWDEMITGNLTSMFQMVKYALPVMRKQKYGRIIAYGFQDVGHAPGWLYRGPYGAAKAGLASFIKTLALEEAPHGITANMVVPGKIVGEMKEASIETSRQIPDEETPVGRSGTGEDIARTIAFLIHEDADMVTGSIVEVTGGVDVLHQRRHE